MPSSPFAFASMPPPPRSGRRLAVSVVLVGVLGLGLLAASRLAAEDDPRFLIEKITVSGQRRTATARIVVAESRLKEGESYDERELREAIYRIRRLPFIVDADFALHRGSRRGAYELAITIEQTTPLFLSYDLEGAYAEQGANRRRTLHAVDSGSLGFREFVGGQGLVFASVDKDAKSYEIGYTQYDPFSRGSFLSATVDRSRDGTSLRPALAGGVALTANQSLRLDLGASELDGRAGGILIHEEERDAALTWIYDTTDDPIVPTRGVKLSGTAGYEYAWQRATFEGFTERGKGRRYDVALSAARHWPLTRRQSFAATLEAGVSRDLPGGFNTYGALLDLQHAVDLWGPERARRYGDLRWETDLEEVANKFQGPTTSSFSLRVGLVFRSTWGLIRLGTSGVRETS